MPSPEHHFTGPMGSEFWRITVPPEIVPVLAKEIDWNNFGRRVLIDPVAGIISWMNPSGTHEDIADATDKIVERTSQLLGCQAKAKRGTRWKGPDDPKNTGLEADAAFYIGTNAKLWVDAFREGGPKYIEAFEAETPPDLVVEVEVTHLDADKPALYARLGIREMWRIVGHKITNHVKVEILDLQQENGPQAVKKSQVLEGLTDSNLPEAFWLARSLQYEELQAMLQELLVQGSDPQNDVDL